VDFSLQIALFCFLERFVGWRLSFESTYLVKLNSAITG
jgi:hypothetical protein